jgi:hypothetical protein
MPRKKAPTNRRQARQGYQIFVSHASADKWIARVMCERLDALGVKTFRDDRDLHGGDDIPETIRKEIKRSQELLVLITPRSVNRPWVLIEVAVAWGRSRNARIAVVLYHVEIDAVPDIIKAKKAYDLNDFDVYVTEVAQRAGKAR